MTALSVIIPALNEENGIGPVLDDLKKVPLDIEVIVVDDGSTDRTGDVARQHGAKVVRHPSNGGYGLSLKDGIRAASNDLVAITDADGTYPVADLPQLVAKMEEGFDMVVGQRHGAAYRGTFLKMPARFVFKFLVEFSTGRMIPDINSGLRVFRKKDVEPLFPLLCDTFSFTTTVTLAYCFLHKYISYIPISYEKRIGKSKVKFIRDSLRTLQFIVQSIAYFNPLKLFLLMSLTLLMLGIVPFVMAWITEDYWMSIFSIPFFLVAVIVFALGIIADMMRMHRER